MSSTPSEQPERVEPERRHHASWAPSYAYRVDPDTGTRIRSTVGYIVSCSCERFRYRAATATEARQVIHAHEIASHR